MQKIMGELTQEVLELEEDNALLRGIIDGTIDSSTARDFVQRRLSTNPKNKHEYIITQEGGTNSLFSKELDNFYQPKLPAFNMELLDLVNEAGESYKEVRADPVQVRVLRQSFAEPATTTTTKYNIESKGNQPYDTFLPNQDKNSEKRGWKLRATSGNGNEIFNSNYQGHKYDSIYNRKPHPMQKYKASGDVDPDIQLSPREVGNNVIPNNSPSANNIAFNRVQPRLSSDIVSPRTACTAPPATTDNCTLI